MSDISPAAVLYDEGGHPVAVVLDGAIYRLVTSAKLEAGTNLVGKFQLRDPGDTVNLGDAVNPVRVDPTGTTTQPVQEKTAEGFNVPDTYQFPAKILSELRQIRKLLEVLTDESFNDEE